MEKRKSVFVSVAAIFLLTACGDDLSITIPEEGQFLPVYAEERTGDEETGVSAPGEEAPEAGVPQENEVTGEETGVPREDGTSGTEARQEGEISETGTGAAGADPAPEESPEAEDQPVSITISAAGDVTLGNYFGQEYAWSFRQRWDEEQDAGYFFENVLDLFSVDDFTIVNLEGPLTRAEERRENQNYCISGDPEYVKILTEGSVEAVSMGNNHRLDYYERGTRDTVAALEEEGITYAYDKNFGLYETKGIRIGFVSVNEAGQGAGVEKYLEEGILLLRQEGADLVLACCHWGIERDNYPEEYQQNLGRKCIDWGADLVIGHHPHVIQGIEEYKGRYIVYSLGNFCFGANRNPKDKDCIIFQQTFIFGDGQCLADTEARVIPCSVSSVANRNDYKPTPAEGDEAQRILDRVNEYSIPFGVQLDEKGYVIR